MKRTIRFPGIPPSGTQLTVLANDGERWSQHAVSIDNVRIDPGWSPCGENAPAVAADNIDTGYMYAEAWTSWVSRPGAKVYRGR